MSKELFMSRKLKVYEQSMGGGNYTQVLPFY